MAGGKNLTWNTSDISPNARSQQNGHHGGVVWLTGLSGSGKSTLANGLEARLFQRGWQVAVLDGDNIRHGLCDDLGFSDMDRAENIRRVSEVAALFNQAGLICITAFISPFQADRDRARSVVGAGFSEIYLEAGLDVCESRDPKGLYKKARAGQIKDFTGLSSAYEPPARPEMTLNTGVGQAEDSLTQLETYVLDRYSISSARL